MAELHLYDFDGTLFRSPHEPDVWEGEWWNDVRSLMPPCVPDDPGNEWWVAPTVAAARKSITDPDVLAVLATGRPAATGLRYRVPELLRAKGLRFDQVHLAPPSGTLSWKRGLLADLIQKYPFIDTVRIWDDRKSHLPVFVQTAIAAGIDPDNVHVTEVRARPMTPGCSDEAPATLMPDKKPVYIGVFLSSQSKAALAHRFPYAFDKLPDGHVTLARDITPDLLALVGTRVSLRVVGYAEDDRIQAVTVALPPGISSVNRIPHVTLSHVPSAEPKEANAMLAQADIMPVSGLTLDGIIDVYPRSLIPSAARVASRWFSGRQFGV